MRLSDLERFGVVNVDYTTATDALVEKAGKGPVMEECRETLNIRYGRFVACDDALCYAMLTLPFAHWLSSKLCLEEVEEGLMAAQEMLSLAAVEKKYGRTWGEKK